MAQEVKLMHARMLTLPLANFLGAVLATLVVVIIGSYAYDTIAPTETGPPILLTTEVPQGGRLTLWYPLGPPARCAAVNIQATVVDGRGIIYHVASTSLDFTFVDNGRVALGVPIPSGAEVGKSQFLISYDRQCKVLYGMFTIDHLVTRPVVTFFITPAG